MANLHAISNVLKQLQVKKPELKEPLVPIRDWVQDPYYVGEGGVFKWNDGVPRRYCVCHSEAEGDGQPDVWVCGARGVGCEKKYDIITTLL